MRGTARRFRFDEEAAHLQHGARGLVLTGHGMPDYETAKQARLGRVAIGGCTITFDDPEHQCVECGAQVWSDGRIVEAELW
jgi:hypothetical protein